MHSNGRNADVLIVGAGPSGLMMACQLALRNVPFRIIDKKDGPTTYSGALIIQARSLEIFQQMGIAQKAISKGRFINEIKLIFNGRRSFILPLKDLGLGLTRFPGLLMLEQSVTEQLLTGFISNFGYSVERETSLLQFSHSAEGVTSVIASIAGQKETVQTKYLIAADGAHSSVRKQLQIPFQGKTNPISLFVTDCSAKTDLIHDQVCFSFSDTATTGFFPLTGGRWRVDGTVSDKQKTRGILVFSDVQKNIASKARLKIALSEPGWFSIFQSNSRYASTFQQSRCFLVGDAAHIHSPVGAQGMNTGLQDSYNLAWKLALVIQKKANNLLLDSYSSERVAVAKNVVRGTDRAFNLVTGLNLFTKTFRLFVLPVILKIALPLLKKKQGIRHFIFCRISQIGIHYRRGSQSREASLGNFSSSMPKPGDRLPFINYMEDAKTVNIQDKTNGVNFHLLIFSKQSLPESILSVAEKYPQLISVVTVPYTTGTRVVYKRFGIENFGCYLVRPDQYIAYRSVKPEAGHFENYVEQVVGRLSSGATPSRSTTTNKSIYGSTFIKGSVGDTQ